MELDINNPEILKPFEEKLADAPELLETVKGVLSVAQKIKLANVDLIKKRDEMEVEVKTVKNKQGVVSIAEFNTLAQKHQELEGKFSASLREVAEEKAKTFNENLKSSVVSVASVSNAENPEHVYHLMKAEGLIGLKEDNSQLFIKKDDAGKEYAVSKEEAIAAYLDKHKHLQKSSGSQGSGGKNIGTPMQIGHKVFARKQEANDAALKPIQK